MKIQGIQTTSFARKLNNGEIKEYSETLSQAKKILGQTGNSVLIVHDACLPQNAKRNTGVANLVGEDSIQFFQFAKKYLGINAIEVLPQGQVRPHDGRYCAYSGSTLSLGNPQISLERLQTPEYENLLTANEFQAVVKENSTEKDTYANFRNVMDDNSAHDKAVKKAFERFQNLSKNSKLKKDFLKYCKENQDWLERKCIFETLSKKYGTTDIRRWSNENDKILYSLKESTRKTRIAKILRENPFESDFYKFKQFLADKHLKQGKSILNSMGLRLYGDFPIGFSHDEVWAYPNAFMKDHYMGVPEWRIPALDFNKILKNGSDANKLFNLKIRLAAQRYDSLRVDAAWNYIKPIITPRGQKTASHSYRKDFGSTILNYLEQQLKKFKGNNFSISDIMYEFEAAPHEFSMFEDGGIIPAVAKRIKVLNTLHMKSNGSDKWGAYSAYTEHGLEPFSLGVGNHDTQPLKQIALGIIDSSTGNKKTPAIPVLSYELNLDTKLLEKPGEFAAAKWAEAMQGKHMHMFYVDVLGMKETFNSGKRNLSSFFRIKIPHNYEDLYIKSLQEGFGFNPMDALEKLFQVNGLDKKHPELFAKIQKFKKILLKADASKPLKILAAAGLTFAACIGGINLYKKYNSTQLNKNKVAMDTFLHKNQKIIKF